MVFVDFIGFMWWWEGLPSEEFRACRCVGFVMMCVVLCVGVVNLDRFVVSLGIFFYRRL